MFCDLVDSTKLSCQFDPEDYRDVVRAYQSVCTEVIHRYDGHVAQLLGDGLLVYFGYPQATKMTHSVLSILGSGIIEALETQYPAGTGQRHPSGGTAGDPYRAWSSWGTMGGAGTGTIGARGNPECRCQDPRAGCSRIPWLSVLRPTAWSKATSMPGIGEQTLRGVAEPIAVYRVLQESGVQSRLDVASTRGLTPLVGRE